MDLDEDKIELTVLALLHLTLHDGNRAWKSFDFDVALTQEGLRESRRLFQEFFGKM